MVEVSERESPRPQRIIRLVESKLEPTGDERLRGEERNRSGDGVKAEPTGAARTGSGPHGGGDGRIAAHLVAFALISAIAPARQSVTCERACRQ